MKHIVVIRKKLKFIGVPYRAEYIVYSLDYD